MIPASLTRPPSGMAVGMSRLHVPLNSREQQILRLLGRLEVVPSRLIAQLCFPDTTLISMRRTMLGLYARKLVWRVMTTIEHIDPPESGRGTPQPPPKAPYLYGLTLEGKALLEWGEVEPDDATYDTLRTRSWRDPDLSESKLTHDLLVTYWCASMIGGLRRCPLVEQMRLVVEYVSHAKQRIDALLEVRFSAQRRPQTQPGWTIPWHDGTPVLAHQRVLRFALEVDRGTEPLKTLLNKGLVYRELTQNRVYDQMLGGPVLPVFVVPPGKRSMQIATEWQDAWPGGPGVITTHKKAEHPALGALWGSYYTLKDNPMQPVTLLGKLVPTPETWVELIQQWVPGLPGPRT